MKVAAFVVVTAALALAGCSTVHEAKVSEGFQMNYDEVVPVREAVADGAIYSRSNAGFFLGDRRAQRVGDLLTVLVDDTMDATKNDTTDLKRAGSLSASLPSALFGAGAINIPAVRPGALNTSTTSAFAAAGKVGQNNTVKFNVTVVVTRVYENGNLWVQGQKQLTLNQGEEYIRVAGLIRPEDIKPGNTIDGEKIAQAQISYTGSGDIRETTKEGWLGRFFSMVSPI